jgi:DNA-binding MarR family transcriptional regulator
MASAAISLHEGRASIVAGSCTAFVEAAPPLDMPGIARALYRLRRRRDRAFAGPLFSEPSWDLMLDLLAAEKSGTKVSVTSACIAAATSTTTALRCLKLLEAQGLVYREPDPADGRRIYVRMSCEAIAAMEGLLNDLGRCLGRVANLA